MSNRAKLLDFDWMAAELAAGDVYSLLANYEDPPESLSSTAVSLVRDALLLSAPVLEKDKKSLPSQMLGRLTYWDTASWGDLPQQILAWEETDWLQPLQPMLTPAGGPLLLTIRAHQEYIIDAAFTAGREQLITAGSRDPVIKRWELAGGRLLDELTAGEAWITAIELLADQNTLISGDSSGTVHGWNLAHSELLFSTAGGAAGILCLAVDDAENVICASTEDGKLFIFEQVSGQRLQAIDAHKTAVRYLVINNAKKQVVTIGDDRHVKVWAIDSGELVYDWGGLDERPTAVLQSDDENILVVGDLNGTLLAWDLAAGDLLTDFAGHGTKINHLLWMDGQEQFISASADKLVKVWNLKEKSVVQTLSGHNAEVWHIALSSDGNRLASLAKEDQALVWDLAQGDLIYTLEGHDRGASHALFLDADQTLLTADFDGLFHVWSLETGELSFLMPGHDRALSTLVQMDGEALISAGQDGTIRVWRVAQPALVQPSHGDDPRALLPLSAASSLATAALAPNIFIWDSADGSLSRELKGHAGNISFLLDGTPERPLISGSFDATAKAWNVDDGELLLDMAGHTAAIRDMLLEGSVLIMAASDKLVCLWDIENGALISTLEGHESGLLKIGMIGDHSRFISLAGDGQMKLWDIASAGLIADLTPNLRGSSYYQMSADRQYVMGTMSNSQPVLWRPADSPIGTELLGHSGPVAKLAIGRKGQFAATAASEIIVWDLQQAALHQKITGQTASIDALLLEEELNRLIASAHDGSVNVFALDDGQLVSAHADHSTWVPWLLSAGDGRFVTADAGGLIHVWDTASGEKVATCAGHEGTISKILLTPESDRLVSTGHDMSVRLWDLNDGREIARFVLDQRPVNMCFSPTAADIVVSDAGGAVHFLRPRIG